MKKVIYLFLFLVSCKDLSFDQKLPHEAGVAMEIYTHVQTIEVEEYLKAQKHREFLTEELKVLLSSDIIAKQMLRSSSEELYDTVFSIKEIPVYSELSTATRIFDDGSSEVEIIDLTPDGINPRDQFSKTPLVQGNKMVRTIIENGRLKSFDSSGKLLVDQNYEQENYSQFLDTLKFYIEKVKSEDQPQHVRSLNYLMNYSNNSGGTLQCEVLETGEVSLMQNLEYTEQSSGFLIDESTAYLQIKTVLNSQMSRTLKTEIWKGNQLLQQKTYTYQDKLELLNSVYKKDHYGENPESIVTKTLTFNSRGIPIIRQVVETYLRNQTFFYF